MSPEGYAQYEFHRMQLMGSIQQVANTMRECAAVAEQFAQIVGSFPYNGNPPAFPTLANGQFAMPVGPPVSVPEEPGKKRKSRLEDTDGKRKKKVKDPNAPKRPASSYLLFQNDIRNELKAKSPGMRNAELLSTIARLWAEMPQEQKDVYESRNKVAKQEWMEKKTAYESHKAEGSSVPTQLTSVASPIIEKPVAPPISIAAVTTPSEESSGVEEDESSEDSSDDDAVPPPKKSKKDAVAPPSKDDAGQSKKEKKHKKSKVQAS